ncbi:MAG TPA: hypothetical protein VKR06_45085, partial [Ktedonosporobacter sp.]|nr:hypothetical protein [Ktedonosporobacter sp.]
IILHIEFQRLGHENMGRRVWEYNAMADHLYGLPVYSVVIYLKKVKNVAVSPYMHLLPNGQPSQICYFGVIKLWEIPMERLKKHEGIGLLPLLTLVEDEARFEVVEEMVADLHAAGQDHLIALGLMLAELVFEKKEDHERLIERYLQVKPMFEDSIIYKEIKKEGLLIGLEEGRAEGRAEALRSTIIRYVEKRYPELVPLAKKQVVQLKKLEQLEKVRDLLFDALMVDEARLALMEGDQAPDSSSGSAS